MDIPIKTDTVSFMTKGQIVIPSWLRKYYDITPGTRALVYPTPHGILLKPLTEKTIHALRGSLKGSKAMKILMAERKRERTL
jgi:bifunctional DNA-binding transcriptional regulator/antitoxin component of YhaV-PrlF toxin-antitoxin module